MASTLKFIGKGLAKKYQAMAKQMPSIVHDAMISLAEDAKDDFEKTVESWKDKPEFYIDERPRSYAVVTDDEIYHFVDKGTRPHKIPVGDLGFLAFRGNYQAKTTPKVIASRPGGASGPYMYTTQTVDHPGTQAREFSKLIHAKWEKQVANRVREKLKQGIEAVGL